MRGSSLAVVLLSLGMLHGSAGRADLDPTLPTRVVVGPPRGAAPMARTDAQRSGRAAAPLPTRPKSLWRSRAAAGADFSVAVDEQGAVVVVSSAGVVTQIDARGRTSWSRRTSSPPIAGAVLTSDGRRAVLTQSSELVLLDAAGRLALERSLPLPTTRAAPSLLPLDDGGLAIAAGETLLRVDRDAQTLQRTRLDGVVTGLLARGGEILAVTERGLVFSLRGTRPPQKLAAFGGRVADSASLSLPDRLIAVVDERRLIELRLGTGARRAIVSDPVLLLTGPAALSGDAGTRVVTTDGMLLSHDARGHELLRAALDPRAGTGESAGFAPPPISDARGTVAFARPGRDAGVVLASGEIVSAGGAVCPDPISLSPAGEQRFVVACRSGLLLMIGQAQ